MPKTDDKDFNLEEYLKKWQYLTPDYNPEYIPKEEREKNKSCTIFSYDL